jgi:hypothetical protein
MATLLKLLLMAVAGWLPYPKWSVEVPPWVFYPLFALLVAASTHKNAREFHQEHRAARARGEGRHHLWTTVISLVVIGGLGLLSLAASASGSSEAKPDPD